MAHGSILLVPLGSLAPKDLAPLRPALAATFGRSVLISGERLDCGFAFDPSRRQFDASKLLLRLLALFPEHVGKVVGVTSEDLLVPCLTFVFGQAQVDGPAAIVSRHRLSEAFYGRRAAPETELLRLSAELCHEVGHSFGLLHCRDQACAMRWSETVAQIEAKGARLCEACARRLRRLEMADASRGPRRVAQWRPAVLEMVA